MSWWLKNEIRLVAFHEHTCMQDYMIMHSMHIYIYTKNFFPESWILNSGFKNFFSKSWILNPEFGFKNFFSESWILNPEFGFKNFFWESWILNPENFAKFAKFLEFKIQDNSWGFNVCVCVCTWVFTWLLEFYYIYIYIHIWHPPQVNQTLVLNPQNVGFWGGTIYISIYIYIYATPPHQNPPFWLVHFHICVARDAWRIAMKQ